MAPQMNATASVKFLSMGKLSQVFRLCATGSRGVLWVTVFQMGSERKKKAPVKQITGAFNLQKSVRSGGCFGQEHAGCDIRSIQSHAIDQRNRVTIYDDFNTTADLVK